MTKSERLEYIRRRYTELDSIADAVLPVTRHDIADEATRMDSFIEHERETSKATEALTSDEQ